MLRQRTGVLRESYRCNGSHDTEDKEVVVELEGPMIP